MRFRIALGPYARFIIVASSPRLDAFSFHERKTFVILFRKITRSERCFCYIVFSPLQLLG